MDSQTRSSVLQAARVVQEALGEIPDRAVVLGSGLGVVAERMDKVRSLPFDRIPGFPPSTVPGHAGRLVAGELEGLPLLAFAGRVHGYEGYTQEQVALPVRLCHALGCRVLLTTNAVGAINRLLSPGDLVLLDDQINLMFRNPLRGVNDPELGPRFPDMSAPTDPAFNRLLRETALDLGIGLKTGVMAGLSGPSYETPAEIRMLQRLGADVVGMSTIPELIAARHLGLPVASISCVTNMAAGLSAQALDHTEVTDTAAEVREDFLRLVREGLSRFRPSGETATS